MAITTEQDLGGMIGQGDELPVPVFFLADSTGISVETMGNALLIQFPDVEFDRKTVPFITTVDEARRVVAMLDRVMEGPRTPLVFTTTASDDIREVLHTTKAPLIDFFEMHMARIERALGRRGLHASGQLHGVGDQRRYNTRIEAVEYAVEHDDGESLRHYERADVILLAPSRCGKTPTTMYLALQHSLFVANYPLVPEDLAATELPGPVRALRDRCFGILSTPARLSQVRNERRPNSTYASMEQCTYELRRAETLFRAYRIPTVNSSTKSVEEMSTVILQHLAKR